MSALMRSAVVRTVPCEPSSKPAGSGAATRARAPRRTPISSESCASAAADGTVSQVTDLVGQYQDAGVQLLISSAYKNDLETHELLAADVTPHFA